MDPSTFAAMIAATAAITGTVASGMFARRKTVSSSAVDMSSVYGDMISRLQTELSDERARREELEQEVDGLRETCTATERRMKRLEAFIRLNTDFDPEQINGRH